MKLSVEPNLRPYPNSAQKRQRKDLTDIDGTRGLVYNIQRYSIHDGPGIRTTIFLKGCSLRCRWCQNPESIQGYPEVGYSELKCAKDYECSRACPQKAIKKRKAGHPIHIDRKLCRNCIEYSCVVPCHNKALRIIGEYLTVEYLISRIKQDALFYRNSNGGVTISGGEPLCQPRFTLNLLKKCREKGFHTALDTSGYADWDILREIAEWADLILYDVKCYDSKLHRTLTGVPNKKILQNLQAIVSQTETPVIARIPVVPGCNDSQKNIADTAKFLKDIGVKEVTLLPYHKLGIGKYKVVGKRYSLNKTGFPDDTHIDSLKKLIETYGLTCTTY